ncbi:MAG: glycosyltransferase [Snowella sp.]|nr:glycosyltransferase [Snowella sp.]
MILVTVGTEKFAFNRLIEYIDALIKGGEIDLSQEAVFVQYGSCTISPMGAYAQPLYPEAEFKRLLARSRLIIAHCGEGTIDMLSELYKPFILVPRQVKYAEHVDDHQMELAGALRELGFAIAYNLDDLKWSLNTPAMQIKRAPKSYYAEVSKLLTSHFD